MMRWSLCVCVCVCFSLLIFITDSYCRKIIDFQLKNIKTVRDLGGMVVEVNKIHQNEWKKWKQNQKLKTSGFSNKVCFVFVKSKINFKFSLLIKEENFLSFCFLPKWNIFLIIRQISKKKQDFAKFSYLKQSSFKLKLFN